MFMKFKLPGEIQETLNYNCAWFCKIINKTLDSYRNDIMEGKRPTFRIHWNCNTVTVIIEFGSIRKLPLLFPETWKLLLKMFFTYLGNKWFLMSDY